MHLLKVLNMTIFDQWKSRLSILIHFLRIRIRSRGENRLPTLYSTGTGIRKKYDPLFCLYNCTRIKCGQVAAVWWAGWMSTWTSTWLSYSGGWPSRQTRPRSSSSSGRYRTLPGTPLLATLKEALYLFLFIQCANQCCGAGAGGSEIILWSRHSFVSFFFSSADSADLCRGFFNTYRITFLKDC